LGASSQSLRRPSLLRQLRQQRALLLGLLLQGLAGPRLPWQLSARPSSRQKEGSHGELQQRLLLLQRRKQANSATQQQMAPLVPLQQQRRQPQQQRSRTSFRQLQQEGRQAAGGGGPVAAAEAVPAEPAAGRALTARLLLQRLLQVQQALTTT
jgi:hypothetical protein